MWCEIRRHTSRHLYRGYWSVIKEERDKETSLSAGLFLRNISTETREIRS